MRGDADLPLDALQSIVREIWHDAVVLDVTADALRSREPPPARSLGVRPTWSIPLQKYQIGPSQRGGPQPEVKAPPKPKRAGWIGGW